MSNKPHDTPTRATAEKGEVMLDGPDGLAMSFTPDAASKSAMAIADAAEGRAADHRASQERRRAFGRPTLVQNAARSLTKVKEPEARVVNRSAQHDINRPASQ